MVLLSRICPPRPHTTPHMMHICPHHTSGWLISPSPTSDLPSTPPDHHPLTQLPPPTLHLRAFLDRTRPPSIAYSIGCTQSICEADIAHPHSSPYFLYHSQIPPLQKYKISRLLLLPTLLLLRSGIRPPPSPYHPSYDAYMAPSHILMAGISISHGRSPLKPP
jgi:hypothetical protein